MIVPFGPRTVIRPLLAGQGQPNWSTLAGTGGQFTPAPAIEEIAEIETGLTIAFKDEFALQVVTDEVDELGLETQRVAIRCDGLRYFVDLLRMQ